MARIGSAFGGRGGSGVFGQPGTEWQAPYLPVIGRGITVGAPVSGGQAAYNRWMGQAPGWNFGDAGGAGGGWQPPGWWGAQYLPGTQRAAVLSVAPADVVSGWRADVGGGGGGGRTTQPSGGSRYARTAPAGVNENWWRQFQEEHEGQTPTEYYGEQGEGLAEAMGDLEWSQQFAEMYGRPPNDDDWRAWWFQKRGMLTPEERERRWKASVEQRLGGQEEPVEERPPLWVPPFISWR